MWQREGFGNIMAPIDWSIDGLLEDTQKLLKSYVKDVAKAYGNELEGIILYGSAVRGEFLPGLSNLNVLLILSSYDLSVLKQYDSLHKRWSKEHVVVPLFLTTADLKSGPGPPAALLPAQARHAAGRFPEHRALLRARAVAAAVPGDAGRGRRPRRQRAARGAGSVLGPVSRSSATGAIRTCGPPPA